jgi:hypothetical protein
MMPKGGLYELRFAEGDDIRNHGVEEIENGEMCRRISRYGMVPERM